MSTTIHIPTPLRPYTEGKAAVTVDGATVGEALGALTSAHTGLLKHLRDDAGKLVAGLSISAPSDFLQDDWIDLLCRTTAQISAAIGYDAGE